MKKVLSKKIIYSVIIIFIISFFLSIYLIIKNNSLYINIIKSNWEIELSKKYDELYSTDSSSIFGEGERYHVLEYKDIGINKNFEWVQGKNRNIEVEIGKIISELKLDKNFIPNFEDKYMYYYKIEDNVAHKDKIFIIYFYDTGMVYVVESFSSLWLKNSLEMMMPKIEPKVFKFKD